MIRTILGTAILLFTLMAEAQNFTWLRGSNTTWPMGVYGTLGVSHPANDPNGRHGCATWTDLSGNLWLFGGESGNGTELWHNDLWKYDPSINEWTWIRGANSINAPGVYGILGVSSPNNDPGAREFCMSWTDPSGKFWLYGGEGEASAGDGLLGDLWMYDPATNEWTWMHGYDTEDQPAVYGTQGVPAPANMPGARMGSATWVDAAGNLWLFGGKGFGAFDRMNDLWKYDPTTNEWTWISGSSGFNQSGNFGTIGVPLSSNIPGAREFPSYWADASGNLYLFGGRGWAASTTFDGWLNDLWQYDISNNTWTWMHGTNAINQVSVYGTLGVPHASVVPGSRTSSASWSDASGNFWLFAGYGYGTTAIGNLNDLFKYDPQTNEWTFMKGPAVTNTAGVYGTPGIPHQANIPGSRQHNTWWKEPADHFWIFGGLGFDSTPPPPDPRQHERPLDI